MLVARKSKQTEPKQMSSPNYYPAYKGLSITNVDSEGRQGVSKNGMESQFYTHKLSHQGDLGSVFQVKIGQGVIVKMK